MFFLSKPIIGDTDEEARRRADDLALGLAELGNTAVMVADEHLALGRGQHAFGPAQALARPCHIGKRDQWRIRHGTSPRVVWRQHGLWPRNPSRVRSLNLCRRWTSRHRCALVG